MPQMNLPPGMPPDLQLALSPEPTPHSQASVSLESNGGNSNQQQQNIEYDLSSCNIDWDFPINWLPYDNEIETTYCSILGLDSNLPQAEPMDTLGRNEPTSAFPMDAPQPRPVSTVASFSPGSTVGVSSTGSGRTVPGDLYATSSNGARRPCTAKSRQLFPPIGLQGYTKQTPLSQDATLGVDDGKRSFPNLSYLNFETPTESLLTELTYSKMCDAFNQICLSCAIFQPFASVKFPSQPIVDYCISLFFEHFNPIFPLVHPQLTDLNENWVLALAVCAVGSQYSATAEMDACVMPFHEFLRRVLVIQLESSEMDLPLAQSLILSQVALLYGGGGNLRHGAYQRLGNLQKVIGLYRRRQQEAASAAPGQVGCNFQAEWMNWVEDETLRRLCYFVWLLDRMGCYFFDDHPNGAFDVTDITLPHDGLWAQTCFSDWAKMHRHVERNPTLATAVNELFRERTTKPNLGEFSRILLLHAVYQEYSTVSTYCKRPLSSWMPQNNPELDNDDSHLLRLSDSNWRNAALDCVDTLHWSANAVIASLLGAEHPTVLHLHFSRVVLLAPRTAIITLAKYLNSPVQLRTMASQQQALQAECEISEWAQQDGSKARLAALHCGCFLWHVRRYAKMAFYEPPCVFWATLTLWAYSVYSSKSRRVPGDTRSGSVTRQASPDQSAIFEDENPTFIRLDRPNDDEMVQLFVRVGVLKAYISGVGDIYSSAAPPRILKEGMKILESVSLAWGRSREYLDLLQALA
ncbi:hypothetical protein F53441_5509 [Fusarium austroafricanum]|uniref:Xylanolytic transcriptional activator regulatory domain-containing protein n=1 Tax=Fusarium austroafricanum TaxID=2364996 RepID=A0A8H4KHZ9_9HYPO|nr:hypothetical protein F53441_5509 [Fusarium austroafricanum]